MGLEEMSVIILTNILECYIWNLFMRSFFNYRVNSTAQRIGMRIVILNSLPSMLEAKAFLRDTSTGIAGDFRSQ